MSRLFSAAFAAVLTFGLAGVSLAAPALTSLAVDGSMAAEGTVGAALTITGSELGTKAPKAALRLHGDATAKPIPLKLLKPFDGTTLHAVVLKCSPGVYDLLVSVKGSDTLTLDSAFTAKSPQVTSISTAKAALGQTIDIVGDFFSSKKGKVTFGGVAGKIKLWTDEKITVVIPKKRSLVGAGVLIDVIGKGGTADDASNVQLLAPLTGGDSLVIHFDNGPAIDMKTSRNIQSVLGFTINGSRALSPTSLHTLAIIHTDSAPVAEGVYTSNMGGSYMAPGFVNHFVNSMTVTIDLKVGDRVQGSFSGTVGGTHSLTGEFTLTIKN